MVKKKTENLQVRITPEIKKGLQVAAERDSRPMASLIENLSKII